MASMAEIAVDKTKELERVRVSLEYLVRQIELDPQTYDLDKAKAAIQRILCGELIF